MSFNPSRATTISIEEIKKYYILSGSVPAGKSQLNSILREQLLQLKELLAFSQIMVERGRVMDNGLLDACSQSIIPLQEYLNARDREGNYTPETR